MLIEDSYETEGAENNSLFVLDLYCDQIEGLFVKISYDTINFPREKITKCEYVSVFNNDMYVFNVFLDDDKLSFVQFILIEFSE